MGLALMVWVGGGLLKRVLYIFGNEPSLGQNSPILQIAVWSCHVLLSPATESLGRCGLAYLVLESGDLERGFQVSLC